MSAMNKVVSNKGIGSLYGAFFGKNSEKYADEFWKHTEAGEYGKAAKNFGKASWELATAGDYKGQGLTRAGVLGLRAGGTVATGVLGDMSVRSLLGGDFTTNQHGERDIAGIPFV